MGIEPYARRYANPKRKLGFSAYRCHPQATRPLTGVPCSTLESSCLPWALVTMWSPTNSARVSSEAVVVLRRHTRFSRTSSRCGFRLDLAVASRAYSKEASGRLA